MSGKSGLAKLQSSSFVITRAGRSTTIKKQNTNAEMLSPEQFTQLLERLPVAAQPHKGSFITCKYFFNGEKDAEVVEAFLSAINIFKRSADIGDKTALSELPIILKGEAGVWWLGVKNDVTTWSDFESQLREYFAPTREPYQIYLDITQEKQGKEDSTDDFIRHKRMLFSQLPSPGHSETQQLDMIYGLLRLDIRDKVSRAAVDNFKDLTKAAKAAELVLQEKDAVVVTHNGKKSSESSRNATNPTRLDPRKGKCRFCRNYGHLAENCRKRLRLNEDKEGNVTEASTSVAVTQAPSLSAPKFSCYGCGAPGVVRANCSTCHANKNKRPQVDIGFCSIDSVIDARDRPVIFVEIGGVNGSVFLDSCAKSSVASYSLYCQLRTKGFTFREYDVGVTLAVGDPKRRKVLVTEAPVKVNDRIVMTTFLFFPDSHSSRTLLGVGFIQDAHIEISLPQSTWHFTDDPTQVFELYPESFVDHHRKTSLAALTPDDSPSCSPSFREETSTSQSYGPLIGIDAPSPPKKRLEPIYLANHSPILDALYEDARICLQNYDTEDELDDVDDALFPSITFHRSM
ncbi:PREDICTED: uncharacterized protein LOC106111906 [Papilio polytes]|uniref:uncharacterized protein LOC106111906 n=1 Tax=Papilio polytes TaxID=76194 RepID=UPI0006764D0B|nr:PREDICTED: uncharacterized protein LOC106111906 [Papilio polytes]